MSIFILFYITESRTKKGKKQSNTRKRKDCFVLQLSSLECTNSEGSNLVILNYMLACMTQHIITHYQQGDLFPTILKIVQIFFKRVTKFALGKPRHGNWY